MTFYDSESIVVLRLVVCSSTTRFRVTGTASGFKFKLNSELDSFSDSSYPAGNNSLPFIYFATRFQGTGHDRVTSPPPMRWGRQHAVALAEQLSTVSLALESCLKNHESSSNRRGGSRLPLGPFFQRSSHASRSSRKRGEHQVRGSKSKVARADSDADMAADCSRWRQGGGGRSGTQLFLWASRRAARLRPQQTLPHGAPQDPRPRQQPSRQRRLAARVARRP